MTKKIIHLFKNDLRISDNPSFSAACENGDVIPIYILDEGNIYDDSAQGWWLINSLEKLNQSLSNNLYMYSGNYKDVISNLVKKKGTVLINNYTSELSNEEYFTDYAELY